MREQNLLGQQIGNYRLIRKLGRGGFAEVYLGEHLHLGIQAAIKILHTTLVDFNEVEQFRAEARTVAHLVHPHIVQVMEFDVQDGAPFLVMRYAPGGTLRHRHAKGSQVPLAVLVTYVKQIASALQYAHDRRLIHRDVKPENMLIGPNQELLLSDFGVALVAQTSHHSSVQQVAGTATYMAPEQFQGKARAASDQYALGVVTYELLTGKQPFSGSFSEVASQHLFTQPAPLSGQLPGVSPAIEQVVHRALAKNPDQRFASVWEFAAAFERVCTIWQTDGPTLSSQEPSLPFVSENQTYYSATGTPSLPVQATRTVLSEHEASLPTDKTSTQGGSGLRRLSRRVLIVGIPLIGIAGTGIAAGVLGWLPSFVPVAASKPTPVTPSATALGSILYTYHGHSDIVEAATWSPDSKRIASASKDKTVQVWNATNGGNVFDYMGHANSVAAVAWSPDGKRLASASLDGTVQVWDAANGGHVFVYTGHTGGATAVAWSPDGTYIASGGDDTTVQVWSASNGVLSYKFTGHKEKIWWVAWSPDGKRIASASDDATAQIWDAATGGNVFIYRGHTNAVDTVAWSPDGTRLASASYDKTVHVWDAADGGHPMIYRGHISKVWSLAWSPDGKRIVSSSADATAQVWDAADGSHPFIYRGADVELYFVAWSPDGKRIVSGGADTNVQVWQAT